MRKMMLALVATCCMGFAVDQAQAQSGSSYSRPSNRPFDNVLRSPSVSPYLNLINQFSDPTSVAGFNSSAARYQNLVRPQLESRRQFSQTQSQLRGLQNQIQQVHTTAIGGISNTTGMGFQGQGFATGHPSVFQYYSRFYPSLGRR